MRRIVNYTIGLIIVFCLAVFVMLAFCSMYAHGSDVSFSTRIIQWAHHPNSDIKADCDPYGLEYRIGYGKWFISGTPQLQSDYKGHDVDLRGLGIGRVLMSSTWLIFDVSAWLQAGCYCADKTEFVGVEPGLDLSYPIWQGLSVFTGVSYFWTPDDLSSARIGFGLKWGF